MRTVGAAPAVPTSRRSYLFLDESGQAGAGSWKDRYRDYICLFGCAIPHDDYLAVVRPGFDALKRKHFPGHDPRELPLHRRELAAREGAFAVLGDDVRREAFDRDLLELLRRAPFTAFAVVVQKTATHRPPRTAHEDPYHFALALLLERYCRRLQLFGEVGWLVIEARNGSEDRRLTSSYRHVYDNGTSFHGPQMFQETLASREPHFRGKRPAGAGLELAELCAQPAKRDVLCDQGRTEAPDAFSGQICDVLAGKWNRWVANNQVAGYGKVFYTWPRGAVAIAPQNEGPALPEPGSPAPS